MSKVKFNFVNHSKMRLSGDGGVLYKIRERFKFLVEGYMFHPAYKRGWDGYIRIIDKDNIAPVGIIDNITNFLDSQGITYEIDEEFNYKTPYTKEYVMNWIDSLEIKGGKIKPYWYQKDAVWEYVKNLRTTLLFPTSSGKSLIQALCIKFFLEHEDEGNVLVILPKVDLVVQLKDDFLDYGLFNEDEINTIMAGKKFSLFHRINISTWQSANKFKNEEYDSIKFMMVDECHNAKADSIQKIVNRAVSCRSRVGLTGTLGEEETEQNMAHILQIIGLFGSVYRPVKTIELIEAGLATDVKIFNIMMRYSDEFRSKVNKLPYQSEIKIINNHKSRNERLCLLASQLANRNENVFMMFRFEEHGLLLYNYLKDNAEELNIDPDEVHFINGKIDTDIRRDIRNNTEKVKGSIIVASEKTFSEGISINNLHHAILCSPVKSKIRVIQTVGRLLRLHESKETAFLWDVIDDISVRDKNGRLNPSLYNYALKHGLKRMEYYDEEGFKRETINVHI